MQVASVERRLFAILAADVVGYSRLTGRDEEGTIRRLQTLSDEVVLPAIASHHGRLVKTTGDGFLVEFGSAVDAVRCAIAIQHTLAARELHVPEDQRMRLRVGVHLGDVVVQGDDILGDGVNVAARIEPLAEPGGICISQVVRDQVEGRVDATFVDLGLRSLKNIERPVRIARIALDVPGSRVRKARWPSPHAWLVLCGLVAIAALLAIGVHWKLADTKVNGSRQAVVAIAPFVNLSGDREQAYLSEGIMEDMIAALGRFRELTVLARSAIQPAKTGSVSLQDVARNLGADYLVEGSVRRTAVRIRLTVQLSETTRSKLLWSEHFDSDPKDALALQDEASRRIAGALAARLGRVEEARAAERHAVSVEAYDLVLRGRALLEKRSRAENVEARRLFEEAIKLDPSHAAAYVGLGLGYRDIVIQGWTETPQQALGRAEAAARKAITLDPQSARAHAVLGRVLIISGQYDSAVAALRNAIVLNPSDAEAHAGLGNVLLFSGDIEEAVKAIETARSYDPYLTTDHIFNLTLAYYLCGRYEDVLRTGKQALSANPNFNYLYVVMAAAQAELGRTEEATAAINEVKRRLPFFESGVFGALLRDPAQRAKLTSGLRKAGLE